MSDTNSNTELELLDVLTTTSAFTDEYRKRAEAAAAKEQRALELVPKVAEVLVSSGLIREDWREETEAALSDHASTLDVLARVVKSAAEAKGSSLGTAQPAQEKAAEVGYIGTRDGRERPSDRLLRERFGVSRSN